jgi:hypothetical protein
MVDVHKQYIIIGLVLLFLIFPVSAVSTAQLTWSKSVGDVFNYPTVVDTTDNGTVIQVGMSNGSIFSYDLNGNIRWFLQTNGSIKKMESNANGTTAWINQRNESGLIQDNATLRYYRPDQLRNITDVAISRDGSYYAFTEKSGARINIQAYSGNLTQNTSFGIANWTSIAFDPNSQWVVTANQSDKNLYLWNLTLYQGWLDFNPTKSVPKNASQINLDSFPYRRNLSIENYGSTTKIYLLNVSNTNVSSAHIYQLNQTYYQYNASDIGKYVYLTSYLNISDQSNVVNASYFTNNSLVLGFKANVNKNFTMYYGNTSYTNELYNSTNAYTSYTTAGSYTFTIPSGVSSVNYQLVGGGGGGGQSLAGVTYHGVGGSAATKTTGTLTIPTGQSTIAVVVGTGGGGGTYGSYTGGTGGTSTLNGTIAAAGGAGGSYTTPWTTGGAGGTGYDSTSTFAVAGAQGGVDYGSGCTPQNAGGAAGVGYGAGGGGTGGGESMCYTGGGAGAKGYANISYNIITTYFGLSPTNSYLATEQTQTSDNSIAYVTNRSLGGNISVMDVPENGGWVGVSTDEPKVYAQAISTSGFGTQYSGTANTGTAMMIRTADSAAYSIEARSLMADIYLLDGTRSGTYITGGVVQSVDFSVRNGLWAIAGGDDGKIYVFSKDATSSWYVFYQGDSGNPITTVSISWRGEYFIVGRNDGTVEYYTTGGISSTTTNYLINVFVNKGGSPYVNQNVTITQGTSTDSAIDTYTNGQTDSVGKFSFTATDLKYYRINVNSGEYIFTYQASSTYTTVTINIPEVMITRPYDYSATYDEFSTNITTIYNDVNIASAVNISITDMTINQIVHTGNYAATTYVYDTYTCGVLNKSRQYKVNIQFTRTTGHTYSDTIYTQSSGFYQPSSAPTTQWLLFKYAVYSVMLMFVALGIGATSTKYGVILLPALAVLGIIIGFLPANLYTGGILVACFIAMLEVMRRRQD